jgi:acetolactate synthase-1/3 small subunit
VDLDRHHVTFEIAGSSDELDGVNTVLEPYGVLEMIRTGKILMVRGQEATA